MALHPPLQPVCSSTWPNGRPLLIENSGLPPTSVAAPALPLMFLRLAPFVLTLYALPRFQLPLL